MNRILLSFVLLCAASVALGQMPPAQVVVAPVEKRPLVLTQSLVASVEPVTRTVLAAEQEGLVAARMFDEGQRIEKGDVLVRMNTDLVKIQRDAAQAAMESAQASVQQAQAELESANRELERNRSLFETNVAPEKEYLDAQTAQRVAAATLAIQNAALAESKAAVERLDTILQKSEVRSPLEGVIAKRHVEVGQAVRQWDPVAELVQLDPLFVRVNVPEEVISRLRVGDPAQVSIDAMESAVFEGKIEQILPEADPSSRTFAVKILLPNPDFKIRPGFFARATLSSQSDMALFVPLDALVAQGQQSHVVVAREGSAVIVPVQRGAVTGDLIAVSGELSENDQVVVRGNESLRGGEPLIVLSGSSTAATQSAGAQAQ